MLHQAAAAVCTGVGDSDQIQQRSLFMSSLPCLKERAQGKQFIQSDLESTAVTSCSHMVCSGKDGGSWSMICWLLSLWGCMGLRLPTIICPIWTTADCLHNEIQWSFSPCFSCLVTCIPRLAAAYPALACFRTSWGVAGYMG